MKPWRPTRRARAWRDRPEAPPPPYRPPERSRAVMAWVDGLTDEQRALVREYGEQPVRVALGMGYRSGPGFVREVREAAERVHARAMERATNGAD